MSFLLIAAIVAAYAILSSAWKFYRNYQDAIRSGLPVILCPVNNQSILYIIAQVPLRPILARFLPEPLFDRVRLSIFGWEFLDKGAIHERVGPAFILVTAGVNELWCADPHMAQSILSRRKDFVQLPIGSKILRFIGENILTSDGDDWSRQRRLIAPSLNERISEIVWDESTTQTERMIDYLLDQPDSDSRHASNLLRTIAINVLAQVGYGEPRPFEPLTLPRDAHARMTYVEGISLCTELLVVAALVPGALLRLPFMPSQIRTLGAALGALPELTADMLHHERKRIASGAEASGAKSIASDADGERKVAHNTFMSQLVRLSDQGKAGNGAFGPSQFLREDEIAGNLFVFTAAGYDTTANTMTYAVGLMAAYPQWQAWLQDELDRVLGSKAVGESRILPYTTYFPKLKRCLAVMMETLRLYPALIHISRSISHDQAISKEGENYIIPGPCTVYINNAGLHHAREDWGNDAGDFRPSRWLTLNSDGTEAELITPARGTFLPWSGGPRVCPGQKMAQVEFVTVMSTLLARLRVEPMPMPGRSVEERREDLLKLMEDSQPRLTLQMNRPEQFALRWIPR